MLNFYLHAISALSLTTFYFAAVVSVGALLQLLLGAQSPAADLVEARETLATGVGFLAIGLPLWLLHWRQLHTQFSQGEAQPGDGYRFYLFSVICVNTIVILFGGSLGVRSLGRLVLGVVDDLPSELTSAGVFLSSLALSVVLWRHHWRQLQSHQSSLANEVDTPRIS